MSQDIPTITRTEDLARFCEAAKLAPYVTVDTEFLRERTWMHASTKAGTLGSGLILVAVAVQFAEGTVIARAVAAILFLLMTAPVAAHLIGRAAFRTGVPMVDRTVCEDGVADALRARPGEQAPD